MNQTDGPEIERALRADIAGAVARGWCTPANACKRMDVDLANAITAELLPLFQQGVEQAKKDALYATLSTSGLEALAQDTGIRAIAGPYCIGCGCRLVESKVTEHIKTCPKHPAREWEAQAVAGAYAAAAKHWPTRIPGENGSLIFWRGACSCGGLIADGVTSFEILWREHILALTPADARQASQIEADGCDRDAACNLAKEHEGECSFSGAQVSQLTALFDATYADLQKVKSETRAAIASAEARAQADSAEKVLVIAKVGCTVLHDEGKCNSCDAWRQHRKWAAEAASQGMKNGAR